MFQKLVLCFVFFYTTVAAAHDWTRVDIPGAICGDGQQYSVFVYGQSNKKLIIEMMGGGACWSANTCYGLETKTWLASLPELPSYSLLSSTDDTNPFKDYSMLYIPYCTGDVHAGNHTAEYFLGIKTHHMGYSNMQKTLAYLSSQHIVNFDQFEKVVLWGASAGAIGALTHVKNVAAYLGPMAEKILISDSPGLHFGQDFWQKFPPAMMNDFYQAFGGVGITIHDNDGLVARSLPSFYSAFPDWRIGILQATDDIIMSELFGSESPSNEKALVLGPYGLPAVSKGFSNVSTWVPDTHMHTFLLLSASAAMKDPNGETALDFAKRVGDEQ